MGYRPTFNNPFEALGRGLQQVGNRAAQFFAQKAQERLQTGVGHISTAQQRKQEIDDIRSSPDYETLGPEQAGVMNTIYEYWDEVSRMSPTQAAQYVEQNPPPQGISVRDVAGTVGRPARPARETAATRQGGMSAGAPPQAAVEGRSGYREITEAPAGQFINDVRRGVNQRARARGETREEDMLRLEAELETAVRTAGIEAESAAQIDSQELQHAHELVMQGKDREARAYLRALDNSYNLQEGQMQFIYDEMAASNAFDRTLSLQDQVAQESRLSSALDALETDPGNPVTRGILSSMANDDRLPQWMQDAADGALNADVGVAGAAWKAEQRARLAAAEAGEEIPQIEVDRARQMLELGEQELIIGGQQIALNQLNLVGEDLRVARERFETNLFKVTSAVEFIDTAVSLGMPEHILMLDQARRDPTHPLHEMASNLSSQQLADALDMARRAQNLSTRSDTLLDAQIGEALSTIGTDAIVRTHELVNSIANTYEPEQIMGLADTNPRIATLMENGLLNRSDLLAAQAQATFRDSLEKDQVNGQRMQVAMTQLDTYGNPQNFLNEATYEEDWQTATAGLTAVLNDMVTMGYMQADQVQGLVASFQAGWRNGANSYEMDKALNDAQIAAYEARATADLAGGGDGDGSGYTEGDIRALTSMHTALIDSVREQNPNCFDPESGIPIGGDACLAAHNEYTDAKNNMKDFVADVMGYLPDLSDIPEMPGNEMLRYVDYILRQGTDPTKWSEQERNVYFSIAGTYPGGEEAMLDALGVPRVEEEPAEESSGDERGFFGNVFGAAPGFRGGPPREGVNNAPEPSDDGSSDLPAPPQSLANAIEAVGTGEAEWGDDNYRAIMSWLQTTAGVNIYNSGEVRQAINNLLETAGYGRRQ